MQRFANKILLLSGWRRMLVAFAAGLATALALAPFHLFVVGFVTFPILVWLLDGAVGRIGAGRIGRHLGAFSIGWSFGLGYFVAGLWWIANALLVEAPEFAWAIPLAVLGLPALLAIFYGFATSIARALWCEGLPRIFVLAAAFGVAEWLRGFVFTGFPWNELGQTIQPSPLLMQSSALTGAATMNIVAVTVFALPAAILVGGRMRIASLGLLTILVGVHSGFGYWRLEMLPDAEPEGRIVRLVQPAIDQSQKWAPERAREIFDDLLTLTATPGTDSEIGQPQLVVWPETAVPFILTQQPGAVAAIAETLKSGQSLLTGVVREQESDDSTTSDSRYFNSMLLIDSDGIISGAADKVHLVPFGEYLPFAEQLGALGLSAVAAADRGYVGAPQRRSLELPDGLTAIPLICYEVIFSNEVTRIKPTDGVMINVTNDAWYGDTPGPYQHFHQSRLRAVETGLPLIRSANNGISAVVDAKGRISRMLDYGQQGAFDAVLPGDLSRPIGKTYQAHIFWLLTLLFATIGLISRSRR